MKLCVLLNVENAIYVQSFNLYVVLKNQKTTENKNCDYPSYRNFGRSDFLKNLLILRALDGASKFKKQDNENFLEKKLLKLLVLTLKIILMIYIHVST